MLRCSWLVRTTFFSLVEIFVTSFLNLNATNSIQESLPHQGRHQLLAPSWFEFLMPFYFIIYCLLSVYCSWLRLIWEQLQETVTWLLSFITVLLIYVSLVVDIILMGYIECRRGCLNWTWDSILSALCELEFNLCSPFIGQFIASRFGQHRNVQKLLYISNCYFT